MRKSETAAFAALMLLSQMLSPATANPASPLVVAQAGTQTSPAAASTPAPGQPAAATAAPTTTVAPAEKSALSTPACSVKYLEAKVSGKLQGRKWVDFRRDECGKRETTAVFPTAIAPKYENDKDLDKARTKTCADQFTANKATKANGGLVWIEKDGGYYAECIIRLKG
ncbi:hypothetical protein [Bradyrhizobium sp.]|uniref:hypothetical protein n=1 Tax=Bradyrhizobium sp. TaxID=376 RepID=UPI003C5B8653